MENKGRWRQRSAIGLAIFYGVAGVLHLVLPEPLMTIMPAWVPQPELVILLTGLCEIAGAIGILTGRFRKLAALGLAIYAVCVYPANIKHAMDGLSAEPSVWQWMYHLVRLPLQPFIVWITLFAGGLITWPVKEK